VQNTRLQIPAVVANVTLTTLLLNPFITALTGPTGFVATQPYILVRHIRAVNTSTTTQYTVTCFYGTANTLAAIWSAAPVAASSYIDWYGELKLTGTSTSAGFLLWGGASNAAIYFNFDDAEIGFQ
jgi:hypothetical protein